MKLVKALNGDWVNVAQASSFNVADFGFRAVVFARVNNTSYELFQSLASTTNPDPAKFGFEHDIPNPDYLKQAESFLEDLFNKLGEVLNVPDNELKSIFLSRPVQLPADAKVEYMKPVPRKRAPRKPKTGEEG